MRSSEWMEGGAGPRPGPWNPGSGGVTRARSRGIKADEARGVGDRVRRQSRQDCGEIKQGSGFGRRQQQSSKSKQDLA